MKKLYLNDLIKKFAISGATIRYYHEQGLMPFLKRDSNGYRYLNEVDLSWVEVIVCLKKTGMSLKDIKKYLDLCTKGQSTVSERHLMIIQQQEIVQAKIAELQNELDFLKYKEEYYQKLVNKEIGIKDHPYSYSN
ncbi:MerR family transcriptional regulator [Spiroplasma platyhelix]|uniref:MerR family transcriptional regulator n=1 Tax=Spiroplasma platyhelix PALS-1 TaxID=1276218 RepID=A0A846U1W9_9MOLU|nr:MerR family transcriptional regulator [Spiroplasma platyhelix]MBE4704414.1 putative HTH-type transcriptional regulator [Spiroplasma platyhelix PALS-1]NKE38786.1 MerR family transcriptional regulator [Spiroplasma platyhelix PALS-1]UJB28997.1 hypothetical protein SPLAT_v1c02320 [Spiroplasma platyhelix PALS-1]